ncbi:MAG: TonB family protein [Bryobacterales bacterium]
MCAALTCVGVAAAQSSGVDAAIGDAASALQQGRPGEAQLILAAALPQARALGAADKRHAETLVLLARAHRALGDLAEPEGLYREADSVMRTAEGAQSVEYARFLNEVGRYYHTRRKYDMAERYYREAFRIRVEQLGQENAEVAEGLCNLAILYENQARFDKAENYYRYALALRRKLLGEDNLKTIETREHFARLLYSMQRTEAEELASEARAERRTILAAQAPPIPDPAALRSQQRAVLGVGRGNGAEPEYTEEARIARQEGTVRLEVTVDADGKPHNPRVVQILGLGLDEQALAAVRQWRFRPARINGKKSACRILLAIDFSLL